MKKIQGKIVPLFIIFLGLSVIAAGLVYYLSPMTRLRLYGISFEQPIAASGPANYLVGWHSSLKSWTEHDGRLDTPLSDETIDETSTLAVQRIPGTATENVIQISPKEWIRSVKSNTQYSTQVVPLNHPSIAPTTILFDKEWTLLERRAGAAWRSGRALQFLIPKFPKGPLRVGDVWTEPLEWVEMMGDWKMGWRAELHWTLKSYETCYGVPCAKLSYTATVTPTLLQPASWCPKADRDIHFTGMAHGEALYNVQEKFMIANTLSYAGTIRTHVPHLEDVPDELRIGTPLVNSDGEVVLQFNNKMDVRLP